MTSIPFFQNFICSAGEGSESSFDSLDSTGDYFELGISFSDTAHDIRHNLGSTTDAPYPHSSEPQNSWHRGSSEADNQPEGGRRQHPQSDHRKSEVRDQVTGDGGKVGGVSEASLDSSSFDFLSAERHAGWYPFPASRRS